MPNASRCQSFGHVGVGSLNDILHKVQLRSVGTKLTKRPSFTYG